MLSPENLLDIKPDWSVLTSDGKTVLIRLAIQPDATLYVTLSKDIGRQFLIYFFIFIRFWDACNDTFFLS